MFQGLFSVYSCSSVIQCQTDEFKKIKKKFKKRQWMNYDKIYLSYVWLTDFNGISTWQGLFYALSLGNYMYYVCICLFCAVISKKDLFAHGHQVFVGVNEINKIKINRKNAENPRSPWQEVC